MAKIRLSQREQQFIGIGNTIKKLEREERAVRITAIVLGVLLIGFVADTLLDAKIFPWNNLTVSFLVIPFIAAIFARNQAAEDLKRANRAFNSLDMFA